MKIDVLEKLFTGVEKDRIKAGIIINPYAGRSSEELSILRMNKVITAEEWFITENYTMLLFMARNDIKNFDEKPLIEQRDIVRKLGKAEFEKQKPILIPAEGGES